MENDFWEHLERLIEESKIVVDRPKGTAHPQFPEMIYPLDYGYLKGTTSTDGGGLDVWVGVQSSARL
ncbi:MAG: inorganic pyrophosphatase, partial [Chloroflexi bacterium]|nr:inorganic pyrophosphatase [Chloroflexota bacterium]